MIPDKLKPKADLNNFIYSSSPSYHQNQDIKNSEEHEPKRKVNKLRSIKLVRLPSLRLTARQGKSQVGIPVSSSPNYMRTTTSSDAKKENLKEPARTLTRRSTFNRGRSLARLASTKFRRSLMRKSSGGSDVKNKMKKSRSIKLRLHSGPVVPDDADLSKSTDNCDAENDQLQASSHDSESSSNGNDESERSSRNLNPNIVGGKKGSRVIRASSSKPARILTKMASLRTKRSSMKKSSQMVESSIQNATCSSALKDSKMADNLELQSGGSDSEGISGGKVCPYSYCSLHGHKHSNVPPLRRFVSMRRRVLKSQKSIKLESRSFRRGKRSGSTKKGNQRSPIRGNAEVLETGHRSKAVNSIENVSEAKAGLNREGSNGENIIHSERVDGIKLGALSQSELCIEENSQVGKSATADSSDVPTGLNGGGCTGKNEGQKMESDSVGCVLTLDHPIDVDLPPMDDSVDACHEEASAGGRGHQEVNGDGVSSLKLTVLRENSELNTSDANTPTSTYDHETVDKSRSPNFIVEPKAMISMDSSASTGELEERSAAREETNEDSSTGSESDSNDEAVEKNKTGKQKIMGLWNLIYQHMVSGIAEGDEKQPPLNKSNKEEEEDANTLPEAKQVGSISGFPRAQQNIGEEYGDGGSPQIQLHQLNAIKLVQEAFDKILSEIPDHTSDDQSSNSNAASDSLSVAKSHPEDKDSVVQDRKETNFEANKTNGAGDQGESKVESNSKHQTPKSWNSLKKIIMLRRFVTALEKVRKISPQKPQHQHVQADPEAERIHLRHQTMGERKNSEEWMLDYALQQVISTLAPAQKRKVGLLIQAFETVGPLPDGTTIPKASDGNCSHATPIQTFTDSSYQRSPETGKETNFGITLRKTFRPDRIPKGNQDQVQISETFSKLEEQISESGSKQSPERILKEDQDQVCDSCIAKEHISETFSDLQQQISESGSIHTTVSNSTSETTSAGLKESSGASSLDNREDNSTDDNNDQTGYSENSLLKVEERNLCDQPSQKSVDVVTSASDEVLEVGEVIKEVCFVDGTNVHDSEHGQDLASKDQINASDELISQVPKTVEGSTANSNEVSSVPVTEMIKESTKAVEMKKMLKTKFLKALGPDEDSKFSSAGTALRKQKNMKLWHLIYEHMVSGNATIPDEATNREDQSNGDNTSYGEQNAVSNRDCPVMSQDKHIENQDADNQNGELQQREAIRMVEEAIDEISLPDSQDDFRDDQSVTSDIVPDQKNLERQPDDRDECSISPSNGCPEKSYGDSNTEKLCQNPDKDKTEGNDEQKPKLSSQKSWSHVKKMILLKRFVKAMEKVKRFNPREPRFLPIDNEQEPEKVQLRHQEMENRKNADEWMLDYALQQVVAKLTPARKRKVELLVEAFETVIPTIRS